MAKMRNHINPRPNHILFVWFNPCISNIFNQQRWMSLFEESPVSREFRDSRRSQNQTSVFYKPLKLLLHPLIIIIKPHSKVLFGMTKNILINMPAAENSVDCAARLIIKDMINYIGQSLLSIGDPNMRKRNIFGFQKRSNMRDNPAIKKISNCSNYYIE